MPIFQDPIFWRGIERIIAIVGGIVFGYLGYKLFLFGVDKGYSKMATKSKFFNIVFSGTGPGLFFMAFGAMILLTALFTGGAETIETTPSTTVQRIHKAPKMPPGFEQPIKEPEKEKQQKEEGPGEGTNIKEKQ